MIDQQTGRADLRRGRLSDLVAAQADPMPCARTLKIFALL